MPLPALSQPIISTFAALSIASVPSIRATNPLHSSKPSASIAITFPFTLCPAQPDLQLQSLFGQFHKRRGFQIAGVAFIGVDVHFENDFGVIAHLHAIEGDAAGAGDAELHVVGIFDAVIVHVGGAHVYVALGADHAFAQLDRALGAEDGAAGGVLVIAGNSKREIDTEVDSVGVAELDLGIISRGAEDADVGVDSLARADDADDLFGGE